jgi:hypothetical protein
MPGLVGAAGGETRASDAAYRNTGQPREFLLYP